MFISRFLIIFGGLISIPFGFADEPQESLPPVSFAQDIKPVLEEKCVHCHNRKTLPERISFENAKLALSTDKLGKVYIVPGKADQSLLIKAIESPDFHEKLMPMVGPRLTEAEGKLFHRWIAEGAEWPKGKDGKVKVTFRAVE